jgi:sugar lactone lactonase YvrE
MAQKSKRAGASLTDVLIVVFVVSALVVGVVAALRIDRAGDGGNGLAERAEYKIDEHKSIDASRIHYQQSTMLSSQMKTARAVVVGPEDSIYVAGDRAVEVLDPKGELLRRIELEDEPMCLAVGGADHAHPGRLYVGMMDRVQPVSPDGTALPGWEQVGQKSRLTAIALATEDVFVADAGGRVVLRYDVSGNLLGRITGQHNDPGIPGFVIPSPFFDVAVASDGLLWVVNPGVTRLEAYTFDGRLELKWGEGNSAIEGFFGCCNPANLAILPDGRFVTAEKGLLRVKIYSAEGELEGVVAGPEQLEEPAAGGRPQFDHEYRAVDIAVNSQGHVIVLDLDTNKLRIFEPNESLSEQNETGKSS